MTAPRLRMMPLTARLVPACNAIVAGSDPWKRLGESIKFREFLNSRKTGTRAYVCIAGGTIAGFILFNPEPVFARGGYLRAIAVAPLFRGKGIGKKLLSFGEKMTAKRSLHFFLCASSFNRSAQAFYSKCGYKKVGNLPGFIIPGESEYIYWKRLTSDRKQNRRVSRGDAKLPHEDTKA